MMGKPVSSAATNARRRSQPACTARVGADPHLDSDDEAVMGLGGLHALPHLQEVDVGAFTDLEAADEADNPRE